MNMQSSICIEEIDEEIGRGGIDVHIDPKVLLNTTDEKRLKNAIMACGMYEEVRHIFNLLPNIEYSCLKLTGILTEHFPVKTGGGLLSKCIELAVRDYCRAVMMEMPVSRQKFYFLRRLIIQAAHCTRWSVMGTSDRGFHTLRLLDAGVSDWLKRNSIRTLSFKPVYGGSTLEELNSTTLLLAGKILSHPDATEDLIASIMIPPSRGLS